MNQQFKYIALLSLVSVGEAIQMLILVGLILSWVPIAPAPFVKELFSFALYDVRPEREMFLYRMSFVVGIAVMALLFWRTSKRHDHGGVISALKEWAGWSWIFISIQAYALFKIWLWGNPLWARVVLYAFVLGALGWRIFWPECRRSAGWIKAKLSTGDFKAWGWVIDALAVASIVILLFIPDIEKALALIFAADLFYHLDGFLMAASWGVHKGLVLNQDMISQYSMVLPQLISALCRLLGKVPSYGFLVVFFMLVSMLYYAVFYFFLRSLAGNRWAAFVGLLLAIKWQVFHQGLFPIAWRFGSPTVVRYVFDIFFFWCLWRHVQYGGRHWLVAASLLCGAAVSYMADTGVYLSLAFVVYISFLMLEAKLKERCFNLALIALIPVVALTILAFASHGALMRPDFWAHQTEHIQLFLAGLGSLPMTDGLKDKQYFAFVMGFIIPVFYMACLLWSAARYMFNRHQRKEALLAVVAIYGLAMYHYFINRSAVTSYYVVCLPMVILLVVYLNQWVGRYVLAARRIIWFCLTMLMAVALLTNPIYAYYPNILKNDPSFWQPVFEAYRQYDLKEDARLINQWTDPQSRVAVISSLEVPLLIDADRAPFFYYFPLIDSAWFEINRFNGTYLHTKKRMQKTLGQLREQRPKHIFVETKLIRLIDQFTQKSQTLRLLLDEVRAYYLPVAQGRFLTVYQRIDENHD